VRGGPDAIGVERAEPGCAQGEARAGRSRDGLSTRSCDLDVPRDAPRRAFSSKTLHRDQAVRAFLASGRCSHSTAPRISIVSGAHPVLGRAHQAAAGRGKVPRGQPNAWFETMCPLLRRQAACLLQSLRPGRRTVRATSPADTGYASPGHRSIASLRLFWRGAARSGSCISARASGRSRTAVSAKRAAACQPSRSCSHSSQS
jgi:hypothetical protein